MRHANHTIDIDAVAANINKYAHSLESPADLEPLLQRIGDARIVMLGEASHGTHEYYTWRSHITKRLVTEMGFNFVVVEGDWPDCYHLNRYIKGYTQAPEPAEVLHTFDRWPTWMWANWEISALAQWMRKHNALLSNESKVGFYGLDVYSLWQSMQEVMDYLRKADPTALQSAEKAYRCFEPYSYDEGFGYAAATRIVPELCTTEVVNMLAEIRKRMVNYNHDHEAAFSAEQNAVVAVNAEKYYRAMLQGDSASWNARDRHMHETLERLLRFHGPDSRAIVWAHNTHIGDASCTDMADEGSFNIGQLAREAFGANNVVLVGLGSYEGSVIAGRSWGDEMRVMEVPAGDKRSWEFCLHLASPQNKLLIMDDFQDTPLAEERIGHRAIGVVYHPMYEHRGNYVPSVVARRYDAFLYIDRTKALHPMHLHPNGHMIPETYPFGV